MAIVQDGFPSPVEVELIEFACVENSGFGLILCDLGLAVLFVESAELLVH